MREEIRAANRLFIRSWVSEYEIDSKQFTCTMSVPYQIEYSFI